MLKNFFKNEEGQGMVEYALILGLIAIVAIVALTSVGDRVKELFSKADNALNVSVGSGSGSN